MKTINEALEAAVLRLSYKATAQGFKLEAIHSYTNEQGEALYWRVRLKHPSTGEKWIRPIKFTEQKGFCLGEPNFAKGKPLYNLHNLTAQPGSPVIVCEGEWCVDKLTQLGILATTSGGADSALKANWQPLAGRSIIIWPDNDEPGQRFAATVAAKLKKLDSQLKQIDVATVNLPNKGDAADWFAANQNATSQDIANLPTINPLDLNEETYPRKSEAENQTDETSSKQTNQAAMLVSFVIERVKLFHDENLDTYAQDLLTSETRRLDSRQFKDWVVANFYEATEKAPRDQSLREALNTLSGLARYKGECHSVYIRVAQHEDAYFLDLAEKGQSRAVRITPGHWEMIVNPPVRFLRPETLRPLPEPVHSNDFSMLWAVTNIPENSRVLVLTWLIECLRPDTPFPILEILGEQGSAKSTTQTILRQLIDPNACDLRAAPKTVEDIFVSAGINWLVSYENISHLSAPMQDALCVIATGGAFSKRKLYSDTDEAVIMVKRPIVLNGISASVTAQDLVDRTISVETPRITNRTEITELLKAYEAEKPKLLGTLLDVFSQALLYLPQIKLPPAQRPRLLEFVRLGMAIAKTLGKTGEDFLTEFNASRQESIARTLDASPVASALIEWFEGRKKHSTVLPIKALLNEVESYKPSHTDAWPRSPKGFADALRRAAPALRQMGIDCHSLGKTGSYVSWKIKTTDVSS